MIRKESITILIALILCICISCESLREFEIPRDPDRLVVSALFPADSIFTVEVSRSNYVLEKEYQFDRSVPDATITLFENDIEVSQLTQKIDEFSDGYLPTTYFASNGFTPTIGSDYRIEVDAPGLESVHASSSIFEPIEISAVTFQKRTVSLGRDYSGYPITVTFDDPPNESNYYSLELHIYQHISYNYEDFNDEFEFTGLVQFAPKVQTEQDIFDDYPFKNSIYLNDLTFDGKSYTFEGVVDMYSISIIENNEFETVHALEFRAFLKHISKDQYDFGITANLQEEVGDDPFSEPVQVHSNIKNGFGIFAGYSATLHAINLLDN